jgi:hypothetical protein
MLSGSQATGAVDRQAINRAMRRTADNMLTHVLTLGAAVPQWLQEVLDNLLENTVKYSSEGRTIEVALRTISVAKAQAPPRCHAAGSRRWLAASPEQWSTSERCWRSGCGTLAGESQASTWDRSSTAFTVSTRG